MQIEIKGGDKWEKVLDEIAKRASQGGVVKIGFLEGAKYPNGTPVAEVAAKNEFGDPQNTYEGRRAPIPSRPFFRNAISENKGLWPGMIATIAKVQKFDTHKVLGQMAEIIKGEIQLEILKMSDPPNSRITIEKKGFNKPLVETAHMLNSVDYEIHVNDPQ